MSEQKIIAVIGATGAQGLPVVKHLLDSRDSATSPWKVRALTRDVGHRRAREMQAQGVELIEGRACLLCSRRTHTDVNFVPIKALSWI